MKFHPNGINYMRSNKHGQHVFFAWTYDPTEEGHWVLADERSTAVLGAVDAHVAQLVEKDEYQAGMKVTSAVLDHFRKIDDSIIGYRLTQPDNLRWELTAEVKFADENKAMLFKLAYGGGEA